MSEEECREFAKKNEPSSTLWSQLGPSHRKCQYGTNTHRGLSQKECQQRAENAGYSYYQYAENANGQSVCLEVESCASPLSGTSWDWKVFKKDAAGTAYTCVPNKKTYDAAVQHCQNLGGEITSWAADQDEVLKCYNDNGKAPMWIKDRGGGKLDSVSDSTECRDCAENDELKSFLCRVQATTSDGDRCTLSSEGPESAFSNVCSDAGSQAERPSICQQLYHGCIRVQTEHHGVCVYYNRGGELAKDRDGVFLVCAKPPPETTSTSTSTTSSTTPCPGVLKRFCMAYDPKHSDVRMKPCSPDESCERFVRRGGTFEAKCALGKCLTVETAAKIDDPNCHAMSFQTCTPSDPNQQ